MIRIGKSLDELDVLAEAFYQEVLVKLKLRKRINIKLQEAINNGGTAESSFYKKLLDNLKKIIVSRPTELESLSKKILPLYNALEKFKIDSLPQPPSREKKSEEKSKLKEVVYSLFNYDNFSKNYNWSFKHSQDLGLNVCPYCNTQYTFTIKTSRGKTRPQFDHFFPKSIYPFFSMSFYNLVPSCYVCNSNLKGQKKFKPSTHIHPLIEGTEDTLRFSANISTVDFLIGKNDFKIILKKLPNADAAKYARADASSKVFHIEEQYTFHKEYAGEIIYKSYLYTNSKLNELIDVFRGENNIKLFNSKEEIIEMLFGNYIREEKLHERVLAKLTKNIANEMGVSI
jgi:hypothetical protein